VRNWPEKLTITIKRLVALVVACVTAVGALSLVAPEAAHATTSGTTLFDHTFTQNSLSDDGPGGTAGVGAAALPQTPSGSGLTNSACFTVPGGTGAPASCSSGATDSAGNGVLRLTPASTTKEGALFSATSVPTSQGLDVTFDSYQWGGTSADGIAFVLAAVDPANPASPAHMGQSGGALGYSGYSGNSGLDDGYLGIGLDVYGNYSNSNYQGSGCGTNPPYISSGGTVPGQVVVRGPGTGTTGYCALASTATNTSSPPIALHGLTRLLSKVPVEVVVNPTASSVTTDSGLSVPAGDWEVAFTPIGGSRTTLEGALPSASGVGIPSGWLGTGGIPKQLAFGWVASTGGSTDNHEVQNSQVASLDPVPILDESSTEYGSPTQGTPVTYVDTTTVDSSGATETQPVTVTDTLPAGVTPTGGGGTGWTCAAPVGQSITCTDSNAPWSPGTSLPPLYINGTVTSGTVTQGELNNNNTAVASSSDADPSSTNDSPQQSEPAAPTVTSVSPPEGPLAGGNSVTVSGTNLSDATQVEIGSASQIANGTSTVLPLCSGSPAAGCFTVSAGQVLISSMPAEPSGGYELDVITEGEAASGAYTYTAPSFSPTSKTLTWEVGAAFDYVPSETGGVTPLTYGIDTIPAGLTLDTSTGEITGTPTAAGTTSATLTATDSASQTATQSITFDIGSGPSVSPTNATYTLDVNSSLATTAPTVTGGASPITWTSTALPAGLSLDSANGVISGTPTAVGNYSVTLTATDHDGATGTQDVSINVNASPSITSTAGSYAVEVNTSLSTTAPTVSGGTGTLTWTSSALPAGLSLDSANGVISGTATAVGNYSVTLTATDSDNEHAQQAQTIHVDPGPSVSPSSASYTTDTGATFSSTAPTVSGGTGPYTWSSTPLPGGLSLDSTTGVISGTATTPGSYSVTLTVSDADSNTSDQSVTIVVEASPQISPTSASTSGTKGSPLSYTPPAPSGGIGPFAWTSTSLPSGLTLDPTTGAITGTPSTPGTYHVTLTATDSDDENATQTLTITIATEPTTTSVGAPTVIDDGDSVSITATVSNTVPGSGTPSGTVDFTVGATSLCSGVTLSPVSGHPDEAEAACTTTSLPVGADTVDATYNGDTNFSSSVGSASTTVNADPQISPSTTSVGGEVASGFTYTPPSPTGGTGTFTWSATNLPPGLSLDTSTGQISGTPTTPGTYDVVLTATDADGHGATQDVTVVMNASPTVSPTSATYTVDVDTPLATTPPVPSGGTGPFTWSSTPLPSGLSLDATTGVISGSPTATGTYDVTLTATDADTEGATQDVTIVVDSSPSLPVGATIPGEQASPFTFAPTLSGGTGPFGWTSTALPAGLTLDPTTGEISGTPTTPGTYDVTITVTDADGVQANEALEIVVAASPSVSPTSATYTLDVGTALTTTPPTVSGGTGPFTWSSTVLPAGLSIDPTTGVISGSPIATGTSHVTLTVADSYGEQATDSTTIVVDALPSASPTTATYTLDVGTALTTTPPSVTGGTGALTWTSTALPGGLSLNAATGVISGSPSATGTSHVTLTATDADGQATTQNITIVVDALPSASPTSATYTLDVGASLITTPPTVTGGTGALTWTSTALPGGLSLNAATGVISGSPSATGTSHVTLTATDADGQATTQNITIVVDSLPTLTPGSAAYAVDEGSPLTTTAPTVTGGTGTITYTVSGTLPAGLSIDPTTGVISGTPSVSGTYHFSIVATDSNSSSVSQAVTIEVDSPPGGFAGGALSGSSTTEVGVPEFSWSPPVVDGGTAPYSWSATGLPPGLSINPSDGAITGSPTQAGTYDVIVIVSDGDGMGQTYDLTIQVNPPPSLSTTGDPPVGYTGWLYSTAIQPLGGTGPYTYSVSGGHLPSGTTLSSSTGKITGTPTLPGTYTFTVTVTDVNGRTSSASYTITVESVVQNSHPIASTPDGAGYWLVGADGGVFPFGDAGWYGSIPGMVPTVHLNAPIVGIVPTPDGAGYWLVGADGGVFPFGDAGWHGSIPGMVPTVHLSAPIVGMIASPDGAGYWLVGADGGVFPFGDAGWYGSIPGMVPTVHLSAPIVGMVPTPDGAGYWLVGADGGVFPFGDAGWHGSIPGMTPRVHLNAPIVDMAATPDGAGYWLVGADGGVFPFGDAGWYGSVPGMSPQVHLNAPVGGIVPSPDGGGYWLVGADGGVFPFGDAGWYGSIPGMVPTVHLNAPISS